MKRRPIIWLWSRQEVYILLTVCVIILLISYFSVLYKESLSDQFSLSDADVKEITVLRDRLDSLVAVHKKKREATKFLQARKFQKYSRIEVKDLYPFDPNDIRLDQWVRFGFSTKQARVILNYRERIGGFKNADQFSKCYVVEREIFKQLAPFLRFPHIEKSRTLAGDTAVRSDTGQYNTQVTRFKKPKPKVDLNLATGDQLKRIYGIGDKLAQRILVYREALGGFVFASQLAEVYGVSDTVLNARIWEQFYLESEPQIQIVDIYGTDAIVLEKHPYISRRMATALIEFQKEFGRIKSTDQLMLLEYWNEVAVNKLRPYLNID